MSLTLQGSLSCVDGGMTVGGSTTKQYDLDATGQKAGNTQVLAAILADLTIGGLSWSTATWLWLQNLSATTGEDMTVTKVIGNGSLTKQGTVSGAAVPAAAAGGAGYYYEITAAGTSQGITWAIGDWAIYSGTSGTWFKITPYVSIAVLKPGESFGPIRLNPDGIPLRAKAVTGTPTIEIAAAGPLA